MVEKLGIVSVQFKDKKADYLVTVYNTLLEKISKPPEHIEVTFYPSSVTETMEDFRVCR